MSRYHHGDLRSALILKALDTIAEGGLEAVSLRGLARDIGVSHAAPSRHFNSRAALLASIAESGVGDLLASARRLAEGSEQDPVTRLYAMAVGYVQWAAENPIHHMLIRNQDVMRHAGEDLRDMVEYHARLHRQTIADAQSRGWRADTNGEALFLEITALTAGLALLASDPIYVTVFGGRPDVGQMVQVLDGYFAR